MPQVNPAFTSLQDRVCKRALDEDQARVFESMDVIYGLIKQAERSDEATELLVKLDRIADQIVNLRKNFVQDLAIARFLEKQGSI